MATVKVIEPHAIQPERLRVAAYCRVSSDSKDQLHSYAAQIRSYTEEIAQHDGWELVDVYADEGLTGTRMDKREDQPYDAGLPEGQDRPNSGKVRIPLRPKYQGLPLRSAGVVRHGRYCPV